MTAIGIDLGTTNSCVAVCQHGKIEVIANDLGIRITPSVVAFNDFERLIGQAAKHQISRNPENTVFDVKRLIGRTYDDPFVKENQKLWGFTVTNIDNNPNIQVKYRKEEKNFCPEQISAMVLEKMKNTAEEYLGRKITDAVLTVPAYFNDAQRSATQVAGAIAGLNILCMINEPTAAAIAYGLNEKDKANLLVFDFGGGTFDVTVLSIEERIFDIKASGGDTNLGGEDINNRLVNYFAEEFKKKHKVDLRNDKRAVSRLRVECERAKIMLSSSSKSGVYVDALTNGIDLDSYITRARFDQINEDIFRRTIGLVQSTLEDANMNKDEIDKVLLVGGSTRIPKIQKLLQNFFKGKNLLKTINQDEAVAVGAAEHAAFLSGEDGIKLQDVIPFSLGIETNCRDMEVIIPRNTKIPVRVTKILGTMQKNQEGADIEIYEGERVLTKDNNYLGTVELPRITPAQKKRTQIDLCFEVDASGILEVSVNERGASEKVTKNMRSTFARLKKIDIEKMILEATLFSDHDTMLKKCSESMCNLENLIHRCKTAIENGKGSRVEKRFILQKCDKIQNWLDRNKGPVSELKTLHKKTSQLLKISEPLHTSSKEFKNLVGIIKKTIPREEFSRICDSSDSDD